jgi:hypothetical protein
MPAICLGRAGCPTPVAYGGKPSCSAGSPTEDWIIYFLEVPYTNLKKECDRYTLRNPGYIWLS